MFAVRSPVATDELEEEIAELAAHLFAGTARFLRLLGEFDAREGWASWGIKTCPHWLSWRCGLSPIAAREHVRVARALRELPRVAEAFERGALSYSKVRALTRIASEQTEEVLLEWAQVGTASQLERVVRGFRSARAAEDPDGRYKRRSLQYFYDDDGSLVIKARLEPEQAAIVVRALESAVSAQDVPAGTSEEGVPAGTHDDVDPFDFDAAAPADRRRADALEHIAVTYLSAAPRQEQAPERALVVVHTDRKTLEDGHRRAARAELDNGVFLHPETVRRIACDAGLINSDDEAQSIGRRTRVVPRPMRRALRRRDRGCRFPACTTRAHVDAHHIRHWARGGETALPNLVLLCRRHHRLVHEGGFSIDVRAADDIVFRRPDGLAVDARPTTGRARTLMRAQHPNITSKTCAPRWDGRHPDYGIAVEGLFRLERRE